MKLRKPQKQEGKEDRATKDLEGATRFISEAEQRDTKKKAPWEEADPKKTKAFNLRLPLDTYAKLKHVAENSPRTSMNNLCIDAIEPFIDKKLKDILQKKQG